MEPANLLVIPFVIIFLSSTANGRGLNVGYYRQTCPQAEEIIRETVAKAVRADRDIAAALIRLHFHDCFVRGCDASILLDSTVGNVAEKDHPGNSGLRGYEIIDDAKARLEAKCPSVVSCADILGYAARDSAYQAGEFGWAVEGGRRDGRISCLSEVASNLPPSSFDVNQLTQLFASKKLSQGEMVTLSGAHSIGVSQCAAFSGDRLYNFSGTGDQDPSMESHYADKLKGQCPPNSNPPNVHVQFDPLTPNKLDVKYYVNLQAKRGLLKSDQTLMSDEGTSRQLKFNAKNPKIWKKNFGEAMMKMGTIDVLRGSQGEIRKQCRVPN